MNKDLWVKRQIQNTASSKGFVIFYLILFMLFVLLGIGIT